MNKNQPSGWLKERIEMLRQELEESGRWPESANRLWFDLAQKPPAPFEEGDEMMFSIVVSDAIDGVDIAERYPDFYRRMLQNPDIFQAFLDAFDILEADMAGELASLPESGAFIPSKRPVVAEPVVEESGPGDWIARWRQSVAQLTILFRDFSPVLEPGFRRGWGILDESSVPLIRSVLVVADTNLGVLLTAAWADDPDSLSLRLTVALIDEMSEEHSAFGPLSSLKAGIEWGGYQQQTAVNDYGQAIFPPLNIDTITDETGQIIRSDLSLFLRPY